jgi:hypothetical protein
MEKNIRTYITGFFVVGMLFAACKKDAPDQWLKDNITIIGKVPVIAGFTVKPPQTTNVAAGSTVTLDLRYWSDDPIDKISLRSAVGTAAQQVVSTTAYQKAYSQVSRTDSLLLNYPVPGGLAVGTAIVMEVEVVNKNTLTKKTTLSLKVQ